MSTPRRAAAPAAVARVTTPAEREIRVERVFDAPREPVWRACTDPELVAQWWGRGNKLDIERMEVERGGHWRYVEHGPEGVSVRGPLSRGDPAGTLVQPSSGTACRATSWSTR